MKREPITEEIKEKLLKLQQKKRIAFLMLLCFFPFGVLVAKALNNSPLAGLFVFVYLIFTGFLGIKVAFHKCPRCHKLFFSSPSWASAFTSKCLNCGINFKGEEQNARPLR